MQAKTKLQCFKSISFNTKWSKVRSNSIKQISFHQQGITYIEIMIVVTILAIIAGIAIPNSSPTDARKLDVAAEKVAQAIRFARLEAIRTGIAYGIFFNKNADIIKVYRLVSAKVTYDVYHPVDKKIYTLNLKTDSSTNNVDLYNYSILFDVFGNQQYLGFSNQGIPKFSFFNTDYMLDSPASITLSYAGLTRVISVSPMVGRVTIQ